MDNSQANIMRVKSHGVPIQPSTSHSMAGGRPLKRSEKPSKKTPEATRNAHETQQALSSYSGYSGVTSSEPRRQRGAFETQPSHIRRRRPGISELWPVHNRWANIACGVAAACMIFAVAVGLGLGLSSHNRHGEHSIGTPFNDTFHSVNATLWTVSNNRTNGGGYNCGFTKNSVDLTPGGGLNLKVYPGISSGQPYGCGQLIHAGVFQYGLFSVAMQAARGPGVVTAAFAYTETETNINQEIDIEITGADTRKLWVTAYRDGQENTTAVPLPFDAAKSVHTYAFAWHSDSIRWYVDGDEVHRLTSGIPRPVPLQYMISTWLRKPNEWAGEYNLSEPVSPTQSHFNWVAYAS